VKPPARSGRRESRWPNEAQHHSRTKVAEMKVAFLPARVEKPLFKVTPSTVPAR